MAFLGSALPNLRCYDTVFSIGAYGAVGKKPHLPWVGDWGYFPAFPNSRWSVPPKISALSASGMNVQCVRNASRAC